MAAAFSGIGRLRRNSRVAYAMDDPFYLVAQEINDERYQGRFDASFWKLREMSLRYQLPRSILDRAGVDRASVSLSGRNLFYIWRRTEFDRSGVRMPDPENVAPFSNEPNYTAGQMPALASWAVTLRVAF
jgi:hypothetical protein